MKVNGYISIDCTGLDLIKGDTPQTITGIRAKVEDAMTTGKPIIAYNANWDGVYVTPIQLFAIEIGDYIICTSSTLQIYISKQDVITINNMAPAN